MCLDKITKRESDMPSAAIGYKIVRKLGDGYLPLVSPGNRDMPYLDGWSVKELASEIKTRFDWRSTYLPGVHAYRNLKDAKRGLACYLYIMSPHAVYLVKVYLRGPICEGRGDGLGTDAPVIVYREMRIIGEVQQT